MAVRLLQRGLVLLVLVGGAFAQRAPTKVACALDFDIAASAETKTLSLVVVLPDSVAGLQAVVGPIRFSMEPTRQLTEEGVRYAIWELATVPAKATLHVAAALELWAPARGKRAPAAAKFDPEPWLAAEKFVEVDEPAIRAAAKKLAGQTDDEVVLAAARFVREQLTFSGFRDEALGAAAALQARRGDCTEYSDLMVALLRARGLPARHVTGFTTEWQDTARHSWVEVHLGKRGWVAFDPTFARQAPELLSGPRPTYIRMSTRRHDPQLENRNWFRYRYTGSVATVVGKVTIDAGAGPKSCTL